MVDSPEDVRRPATASTRAAVVGRRTRTVPDGDHARMESRHTLYVIMLTARVDGVKVAHARSRSRWPTGPSHSRAAGINAVAGLTWRQIGVNYWAGRLSRVGRSALYNRLAGARLTARRYNPERRRSAEPSRLRSRRFATASGFSPGRDPKSGRLKRSRGKSSKVRLTNPPHTAYGDYGPPEAGPYVRDSRSGGSR
jgi:hypothetical protein